MSEREKMMREALDAYNEAGRPELLRPILGPRFDDGCPQVFADDGCTPEHDPSRNLFCDFAPSVPPSPSAAKSTPLLDAMDDASAEVAAYGLSPDGRRAAEQVARLIQEARAEGWDERDRARPQYLGLVDGHYPDCMGWTDCRCGSYPNPYRAR